MIDDPVVLALRAALAAGESLEIRIAIADRLLALNEPRSALDDYEAALRSAPTHPAALDGARRAAEATGDHAKATAYAIAARAHAAASPQLATPLRAVEAMPANAVAPAAPGLSSVGGVGRPAAITAPAADPPHLRLVPNHAVAADEPAEKTITLADVGGMEAVKARLERAFLAPLRNPQLYKSFGRQIRGGLVLFGPPGCGKTFIARALAGEIGAKFVDIGLSDVLDMWFGNSEQNLHTLFENARRDQPSVVFLDEIDALGQRRAQLKGAAGRTLVNQLLVELDGTGARNTGVFVLGATNHPWDLDPALRRPGRFDQLMFVPPPDGPARARILALQLADRPTVPGLELARVVSASDGFSGADLAALVDHATDHAIERSLAGGTQVPVDETALLAAARGMKPSARAWLETARNYAVYANEGGMLDDLLAYLKKVGIA